MITPVSIAMKHLGLNSGTVFLKYIGLKPGLAYCLAFSLWCWHQAQPSVRLPRLGRVNAFYSLARVDSAHYAVLSPSDVQWGITVPVEGDFVLFNHDSPGVTNWSGHAGLYVAKVDATHFDTVEGNTSCPARVPKDERNGGCIARKTRRLGMTGFEVVAIIHPRG